jgi:hypothetical protein
MNTSDSRKSGHSESEACRASSGFVNVVAENPEPKRMVVRVRAISDSLSTTKIVRLRLSDTLSPHRIRDGMRQKVRKVVKSLRLIGLVREEYENGRSLTVFR